MFLFFQNALKILAFAWRQWRIQEGVLGPAPLANFFCLHRKNIGKLGLPPLCEHQCPAKIFPLFEILNTPLHGALPQTPLGSVQCYPDFVARIWVLSWEREKEMRYCGIGRNGEYCEASLVLMDHFNQLFVHQTVVMYFQMCASTLPIYRSPNPFPKPLPGYNRDSLSVRAIHPQFFGTSHP